MDKCSKYIVRTCALCPADTEYFCLSCSFNLCLQCKEYHVFDLETIDHNVVIYRSQYNFISKEDIIAKPIDKTYGKHCEHCLLPACDNCNDNIEQKMQDCESTYKKRLHKKIIHTIRSEILPSRLALLERIKIEVEARSTKLSFCQSGMLRKAQNLKDLVYNEMQDVHFNHMCSKLKLKMKKTPC